MGLVNNPSETPRHPETLKTKKVVMRYLPSTCIVPFLALYVPLDDFHIAPLPLSLRQLQLGDF
jgi:hypothetical protein